MDDLEERRGEALFDVPRIRNYLAFVGGALRRRRALVLLVTVSVVGGALLVAAALPKTWHVEAKVLARRNAALTVRGDGPGAEALTRTAAETVLRRDNLVALVEQSGLVEHWEGHRSVSERVRDGALRALGVRREAPQEQIDGMVERLEKRLVVWTNEGASTVSIGIDWPDGPMACRIVDAAQQDYLEAQHAQEISALSESMTILVSHAAAFQGDVDRALVAVARVREQKHGRSDRPGASRLAPVAAPATAPGSLPAPPPPPGDKADDPALLQVQLNLDARQRTLEGLEEFRRRRLADLQARLADEQTVYTEAHPSIVDLKQAIAAMSGESAQMVALREQVSALRRDRDSLLQRDVRPASASGPGASTLTATAARAWALRDPTSGASADLAGLDGALREERDPSVVYARAQLLDAMDKYADLRSKIQAAQIDYETAQAAFKYRYTVVTPARLPREPLKPKMWLVALLALAAAGASSVVAAVIADLRKGTILELWQAESILDEPVVAEVEVALLPEQSEP